MSYYRLDDCYALRMFTNKEPCVVGYADPQAKWTVTKEEMSLLKKCDGVTDFDIGNLTDKESEFLGKLIKRKVVKELTEPLPLKPNRAYREFNHKRIASANWAITLKCNMNCLHCLNLADPNADNESEMSLDEAKTVIQRLADYGVEGIEMFGGEPTFHKNFMDIVRLIYDAGMIINSIDTNGMFITDKMLDEFENIGANPILAISFDGLGTHDWMRNQKGSEEKVKKAIKLCVDRGFSTNIGININRRTLPNLEKTIDYFRDMGCRSFKLLRTSESFRWMRTEKELGEQLTIPTMEFAAIMLELLKKMMPDIRNGIYVTVFNQITIGPHSKGKHILLGKIDKPECISGWCPAGENGVFIGSRGHVAPCPGVEGLVKLHGLYSEDICLLNTSLEDIVYGDFYRSHFRITKADVYNASKECRECEKWDVCSGGICRMNATMLPETIALGAPPEKKYFSQRDPVYCSLQKGGYLDAIAKLLDEN